MGMRTLEERGQINRGPRLPRYILMLKSSISTTVVLCRKHERDIYVLEYV